MSTSDLPTIPPHTCHADVVVIGSGITALSTLFHLKSRGIKRLGWSTPPLNQPHASSWLCAGLVTKHPMDFLTRFTHRYGLALGQMAWTINDGGFSLLEKLCDQTGVSFFTGRQTHLISSSHEQVEAEQCVQLSLHNTDAHQLEFHPKPTIVGSQGSADFFSLTGILAHAAGTSGWFDPKALFQSLLTQLGDVVRLPETAQVSFDPHGVKLTDVDGQTFRTEMAIAANHLQMRELIPGLGPAFIKLADQWDEFSVEKSLHDALQPGLSFSMNYGQTWGVVTSIKTIRMGGSRFLRPMAGVDANTAAVHPKVTQYHQRLCQNILAVWPSLQSSADALRPRRVNESQLSHARSQGYFDILPCDETPVIGPMFGEPRLLCGTGYYGYGFPLAVQAGAWLAEIIARGQAEGLPKEFWPHRLRNLGEP